MSEKVAVGSWSTGFCDCFSDCGSCCLTFWCPCVSFGRIADILDKGSTSCCVHGTLSFLLGASTHFIGAIYAWMYRTKLRKVYGIEGNQCWDCLVSCLCPHLSICQEYRELKARGFHMSAGWEGNVQMRTRGVISSGSGKWHDPLDRAVDLRSCMSMGFVVMSENEIKNRMWCICTQPVSVYTLYACVTVFQHLIKLNNLLP